MPPTPNRFGRILGFFKRLVVATIVVSVFFVFTQDFQIFPGMVMGLFGATPKVPSDVQATIITTKDGVTLPLWRVQAKGNARKQVILLFHGNGDSVASFVAIQRVFANIGFTSYTHEYRGYPGSSGFPSEAGLYLDGEAAIETLLKNEGITPRDVIIYGNSVGSGPAAYIAQKYGVGTLLFAAPYSSIVDVVRATPFLKYLAPFLWYKFPTEEYVSKLKVTCVVDAHGKLDATIPYEQSEKLKRAYRGLRSYTLISPEAAGHNDIFAGSYVELFKAMNVCLSNLSD